MTQFGQVGNAVPPKLGEAIATAIRKQWFENDTNGGE